MKIFKSNQLKDIDRYTIDYEPVKSIDLMERAADGMFSAFVDKFSVQHPVCIVAGHGNNGGDALAIARKLKLAGYTVSVKLVYTNLLSPDCEINKTRIIQLFPEIFTEYKTDFKPTVLDSNVIIVDGLFGSGLSRPITGIFAKVVNWMNNSGCDIVALDIPSGLNSEENTDYSFPIVKATLTFSLQFPKLAFFFPENSIFVGKWEIIDIQLHAAIIERTHSEFEYLKNYLLETNLKKRTTFSHKGTYGHLCVIAGSKGMAGASVLSAKAALRSGAGLVTIHGPECNRVIAQTAVPEIIFSSDKSVDFITELQPMDGINSFVIGPGLGKANETIVMLKKFLENCNKPCLIDADALNFISENKELLLLIPKGSIITPHPKEFERLVGKCSNSYDRMNKAREFAVFNQVFVILKGAFTFILTPENKVFINCSGNTGMATAGSGDVLSGIVGSLLAQGYTSEMASLIGVHLHGIAGDIALNTQSEESLIAEDIVLNIGNAFKRMRQYH